MTHIAKTSRNLVLTGACICLIAMFWSSTAAAQMQYGGANYGPPVQGGHNPNYAPAMSGVLPSAGFSCNHCGYTATNPPAQPQVAGGRCPACTVAIDCADNCGRPQKWGDLHRYNFQPLAHGEFMGPIRVPSTVDYRIRVGDQLLFTYIESQQILRSSFRLQVGDQIQISSLQDADLKLGDLNQGVGNQIQPNGAIYLNLIGEVPAAGQTIPQLRANINQAYKKYVKDPAIDVIPIKTNTLLASLLESVDGRAGSGGRNSTDTVHADGTIRLPKLGAICVLGMTIDEMKREVNLRYAQIVSGLEVEPSMAQEAPHNIYVYGEVGQPGRFTLTGPTSVTEGLALAQGISVRGNKREVVIFRRAEDWRLIVTRVDLAATHYGKSPTPSDEIWLRDNDLLIVPPTPVTRIDDFIDQVFTRGIYGVFPFAQIGEGFNANAIVQ